MLQKFHFSSNQDYIIKILQVKKDSHFYFIRGIYSSRGIMMKSFVNFARW